MPRTAGSGSQRIIDFGVIQFGIDGGLITGTRFACPFGAAASVVNEVLAQWPCPHTGTISKFRSFFGTKATVDATCVLTLRKNGFDTGLTITHVAGSVDVLEDLAHSVFVNAGDLLALSVVTTPNAGVNPSDLQTSFEISES